MVSRTRAIAWGVLALLGGCHRVQATGRGSGATSAAGSGPGSPMAATAGGPDAAAARGAARPLACSADGDADERAAEGAAMAAEADPGRSASVAGWEVAGEPIAGRPKPAAWPFGQPTEIAHYTCPIMLPGGPFRSFLAKADTKVAFVDGDDLLAVVNRSPTGALSPTYAPRDLVDLRDGKARTPAECENDHACLRREARDALDRMLASMRADGVPGQVESAFRGFVTQCWVFSSWAGKARGGFCEATAQSALPGHSQHQLGTTVDLFTSDWAAHGPVFRDGFGCSPGGQWLDEHSWTYGFVVSYPIHPDDRKDGSRCRTRADRSVPIDPKTGYKHEPWHLRFIGLDAAARFHDAWLSSGPGTPGEIALEQWLRARRGLVGDAELPVCDRCQCGACATLAGSAEKTPCGDGSLWLGPDGRVAAPAEDPRVIDAAVAASPGGGVVVEVRVHAPAHAPTQTPVTTEDGPAYGEDATFAALSPYPDTRPRRYEDLPGAWRVAIEAAPPAGEGPGQTAKPGALRWPWRASLARADLAKTWNRANLVLPAKPGDTAVKVRIVPPSGVQKLRVTLLKDGVEHDTHEVSLP
jgi:D-alanyl-D-alanine carboxypeptidase